jgi:hypothetical protein
VDFEKETVDIQLTLEGTLFGVLSAEDRPLDSFWNLQPILLSGSGFFSNNGGELTGAFTNTGLEWIKSVIKARSNSLEDFRGYVDWIRLGTAIVLVPEPSSESDSEQSPALPLSPEPAVREPYDYIRPREWDTAMSAGLSEPDADVFWGYWEQGGDTVPGEQNDRQQFTATATPQFSPDMGIVLTQTQAPSVLPQEVRTFQISDGSTLSSIGEGSGLKVTENSSINVDFINETLDIQLTLEGQHTRGDLFASQIDLVRFWELQPVVLSGRGDFSQHGGELTGAFADEALRSIMSVINARSDLDEYFRGNLIWENNSLNISR